jgi:hypothetical protein
VSPSYAGKYYFIFTAWGDVYTYLDGGLCKLPLMRKFTAILGLSIISAFFSPVTAQALSSDCYTYSTSGSTATITGTSACTGAITVPSTLGGKTVVAIDSYAFGSESAVTSITLPDTVTTIDTYSFYQMPVLTYLNLGNGVHTLGSYNVYGCPQLATLILGSGFRTLDTYAFTGNSSLTTINLPDGTTSINTYAFGNNAAITSVTIPASVVNVETYAFLFSNLTDMTALLFNQLFWTPGTQTLQWDFILQLQLQRRSAAPPPPALLRQWP